MAKKGAALVGAVRKVEGGSTIQGKFIGLGFGTIMISGLFFKFAWRGFTRAIRTLAKLFR